MTADQVRVGARVRDRDTGRVGTVRGIGTLSLGLAHVELDATAVLRRETVWLEIEDLERAIPDSERMR